MLFVDAMSVAGIFELGKVPVVAQRITLEYNIRVLGWSPMKLVVLWDSKKAMRKGFRFCENLK